MLDLIPLHTQSRMDPCQLKGELQRSRQIQLVLERAPSYPASS